MLEFNPDGKKTILTIDGGGMRGVISIAMLAELEAMTGKPAYDLFDMVAGTSTGAIIAAGLGLHMTAQQILDEIYKDKLANSFQPQNLLFWLRYVLGGLRSLYDTKPFHDVFDPITAGKKVGDLTDPIIMMTTKDLRTSNTYYIVSAGPGRAAFADWPLSGAVAASGSAPIYFPPVAGNLVDGGVGVYANPCLAATIEALEYIQLAPEESSLVISLGTGYVANTVPEGSGTRFWLKDWIEYLIIEGIDDAALQQVYTTRRIYRHLDFRRYNPYLDRAALKELSLTPPPNLDPTALTLDSHAPAEVNFMEQIGRAYARALDWTKPNVMPWETSGGHPQPGILPMDWSKTEYK